jgi:hypothetical protein
MGEQKIPASGSSARVPASPVPSESSTATTLSAAPREISYRGFDLWLHRVTMLLFVFVCAVVGVLLVILPWRPEWTDNHLLTALPGLRALVASGFVRGVCSGLGVLDIWIGFWEAIHYHEIK